MADNTFTIPLQGRINSDNSAAVEQEIMSKLENYDGRSINLDASNLEYISSAGLRVILRLKKEYPDITVSNVSPEIYEIFDMTGFTEMMNVEKAYRVVSIEGCEEIGKGANGTIYRIDKDNVVLQNLPLSSESPQRSPMMS